MILTRDQREGETPGALYGTWRHLDRWIDPRRRETHSDVLRSIDVSALSPRIRFLFWHTLVLSKQARSLLDGFPNLRPLAAQRSAPVPIDPPLILRDPPQHSWSYFHRVGIWL